MLRHHPIRLRTLCVLVATFVVANIDLAAQDTIHVTLQDAIDLSLEHGRDARAAVAARNAARYREDSFNATFLPQLSFTSTVPRYNRSIIEVLQPDGSTLFRPQDQTQTEFGALLTQRVPLTGGSVYVSSSLSRLSVSGAQDALTYQSAPVRFGFTQPVLQPNTDKWDRKEQPVLSEVNERQYLENVEAIALQTTSLFFDVYAAQVSFQTATTNAAVNDTLYTLNNGRYQIGKIGENDLLQSELALLRAQSDLEAAELAFERALAALRIALNLALDTPIEIVVSDMVPDFEPDTTLAVSEALRNRAVVANLELQDLRAERGVAEAKLNNGLSALLTASYGFNATGSALDDVYQGLLESRQLRFDVEVPLVQWGVRRGAVRAAEAERDRVASTTEVTLERTAHEARFAALQLSQARRTLELSAKGDTVGTKRFEVAYNRYVIGRISIDNLFIAQREKDQARDQYVRALRGYWEAYYELRRATLYDFEEGRTITR